MRIQRLRHCAPYQVEDDNPYIPEEQRPRMIWRTTRVVDTYDDVVVRQLGSSLQTPGLQFELRIPLPDPETGTDRDADGDLAVLRVAMVGATVDLFGGSIAFKGFVSKEDLLYEEEYRKGSLDGCLSTRERYDLAHEYVCEEWQQIP